MEKVQSIGFIGGGMMAGAILDGMVNRMKKNPAEIFEFVENVFYERENVIHCPIYNKPRR